MAELMGATPPKHHYLHDLSLNPLPFRRGPMYSAYAELRDWKLRTRKKKKNNHLFFSPPPPRPSPPPPSSIRSANTPMASRSVQDLSVAFRKENRRPPFSTPPPPTPKREVKRAMSSARELSGVYSTRKSYACLKELKEYSVAAGSAIDEEGRSGGKKNAVGSVRRPRQIVSSSSSSSMNMSWMG